MGWERRKKKERQRVGGGEEVRPVVEKVVVSGTNQRERERERGCHV